MTMIASIYGRLGSEPETRVTQTGKEMIRASVAVDVGDARERDQGQGETLWVSVLAFGRVGEVLARAAKGETCTAIGKLTRSRFEGRDGAPREKWTLLADAVVCAQSARPSSGGQGNGPSKPRPSSSSATAADHRAAMRHQATSQAPFDDDIPF